MVNILDLEVHFLTSFWDFLYFNPKSRLMGDILDTGKSPV